VDFPDAASGKIIEGEYDLASSKTREFFSGFGVVNNKIRKRDFSWAGHSNVLHIDL
jgi:hypothetical protein